MQAKAQAASGRQKMPNTQVVSLMNDRLLIIIRSWNGPEINQKVIDEISHYVSAAEADLEVTSPFEYSENLTPYANKVKVALLLANDAVYHTDNREVYQHGAEVAIFFHKNNEIAWASIGRFSISALKAEQILKIYDSGGRFDDEILLPVDLIGLHRNPEVNAGSISVKKLDTLEIKSVFGQHESVWECSISI